MSENTSKTQHITALDFDITRAEAQLILLQTRINEVTKQIASSNWTINAIINGQSDYNNLRKEVEELRKRYAEAQKQIDSMREVSRNAAETMTSDIDNLTSSIESKLVNALKNASAAAYEAAKSTEDSMVEIGRVLNLTSTDVEKMRDSLFGLGKEYGRSFSDVSAVALRYAQAGNDMNDTLSLTNDFMLALNTAELDVENGVQSLIGIMNQWGMEASDLSTVIDKLNYTADNNAVTTQDLVDGLLKASSMAKTAGMSFDDTVGSLTAMKVASGAAGKEVGNAFKSILAYIQRPDSLKTFDSMGIDVFKDKATGELLPMMEILQNMSEKWNTSQEEMLNTLIESGDALQMMSEEWAIATDSMEEYTEYQEAVAEATDKANDSESRAQAQAAAGVFRRNYYISLMENFNKAMEISADLVNSEGHSMAENSRYMETLTAKTEQLRISLVELAVTAADAGFIDFAKDCFDAAASLTQWVTNTKTLIPLLTSLAGIMLTIKQREIAHEINSTVKAFENAGNTIINTAKGMVGVSIAADSAGASMNTAATAATGLNATLGAIGLIVTGISLAATAITAVSSAIKEARMEAIEAGKTANENASCLFKLRDEYKDLENISEKTAEQEERMAEIQREMVKIIGDKSILLRNLTEGTYKYTEALKEAAQEELENLKITQLQARNAAKSNLSDVLIKDREARIGSYRPLKLDSASAFLFQNGYAKFGNGTINGYAAVDFKISNDIVDNYVNLSNAMEELNKRAVELSNTYGNDVASAFLNDSGYVKTEKMFNKIKAAAEEYIAAEINLAETDYLLNNQRPKTIEQQKAMEETILDSVNAIGELREVYRSYISELGTIDQQKVDFFELINLDEYETAQNALIDMAKAGELNETVFNSVVRSVVGLSPKINGLGLSSGKCIEYINELVSSVNTAENNMSGMTDEIEKTDEKLQSFTDTISSSESSISNLNKYIDTLNSGNGLTAQQVMELCSSYGLLAEQFTLTEKGYKIEVSALETLRNAQIETAVSARKQQAEYTNLTTQNIMERISAYGLEIESITSIAEAEAALLVLETERAKLAGSINSAGDVKYYMPQISELDSIIDSIRGLKNEYSNIEAAADDFYKNLGKSFESVSQGAEKSKNETEETVDALKNLTEGFEHLVSLGAYSVDEQIAYYERLRRELDLTEEQYQSLETTLHKLYRSQVDEQMEAVKEAYEKQKQAVEDYYDSEKETLEKTLEEEKSAREEYWDDELDRLKDNLNSQISAAKSAYEAKKKLSEKSYDNQLKALESLRDNELDNIKAVYDAQISALEKIKAARNSERNEEDYQDERAELLEQISYWEQRTSTEAVENIDKLKKQLADLDRNRSREREDEETDKQISSLKDQRDSEAAEAEKYYNGQIAALKAVQDTELEMYENTYNREIELLEKRLETEVKALEKKRDDDLKLLDEQQEKKLADLDTAKEAAVQAEEDKWEAIQEMFTEQNLNLIASAGEFAPQLYDQFHELFTKKFEMDLEDLSKSIKELDKAKSKLESGASGLKPKYSAPSSIGKSPAVPQSGSSTGFSVGTKVKVSGTLYGDSYGGDPGKTVNGKIAKITRINRNGTKPYSVDSLGWVDESQLVKARTGGKTTADGIAMLHKDELIINPPTTKKLEDLMKELRPAPTEADIKAKQDAVLAYWCREIGKTQRAMIQAIQNHNNTYNTRNTSNVSNSYHDENSRQIIQNFNAPLQHIERVEDGADINAAVNAMEREIMRKMAGML